MSRRIDWSDVFMFTAFGLISLSSVGSFLLIGLGAYKLDKLIENPPQVICDKDPGKTDKCRLVFK